MDEDSKLGIMTNVDENRLVKVIFTNIHRISECKSLLKRKENCITPAKTNGPISETFSEHLKLIIQTYQMRNKELKNHAWTTSRGNIKSIFDS